MSLIRNLVVYLSLGFIVSGSAFAQMECMVEAPEECATFEDIAELLGFWDTQVALAEDGEEINFPDCFDPETMTGMMTCDETTPATKAQVIAKRAEAAGVYVQAADAETAQYFRFRKVKNEVDRLVTIGLLPKSKAAAITNILREARTEMNVSDQNFILANSKGLAARMAAESGDLDGAINLYGQKISNLNSALQRQSLIKVKIDSADSLLRTVVPNWTND